MNKPLEFVLDSLQTEETLNRLIFNSVVDTRLEERIKAKNMALHDERLLHYFFKTQRATERLEKAFYYGLELEAERILKSQKSVNWKKKQLNVLAKTLEEIIKNLFYYGEINEAWEERFEKIVNKIGSNTSGIAKYIVEVNRFQNAAARKIDSKIIVTENDFIKEWTEAHQRNEIALSDLSLPLQVNVEEILFYHVCWLFGRTCQLCELFTKKFRGDFHFSMSNILKGQEIKVVEEKVKLTNEKLNLELFEILKHHVSPKSAKTLQDFWEGKDVLKPIEFLGEKGHLFSVFRLLYNNRQITRKPKLIGALVAKSFILPNCEDGSDINPERVREAISRKVAPSMVLPEILDLAVRTKLYW